MATGELLSASQRSDGVESLWGNVATVGMGIGLRKYDYQWAIVVH